MARGYSLGNYCVVRSSDNHSLAGKETIVEPNDKQKAKAAKLAEELYYLDPHPHDESSNAPKIIPALIRALADERAEVWREAVRVVKQVSPLDSKESHFQRRERTFRALEAASRTDPKETR